MAVPYHARCPAFLIVPVLFLFFCLCATDSLQFNYKPPVTFVGYVNGDYDSLPGNRSWPNTCRLIKDTVRMYFFSDSFSEKNSIRSGDLLRIDIFRRTADSLIGTRDVKIHMARYFNSVWSYDIVPADTLYFKNSASMRPLQFSVTSGASIELDRISMIADPVAPAPRKLDVRNGRIFGAIE